MRQTRKGILGDVRSFLVRRPEVATRIDFASRAERQDYSYRMLQRLDVDVDGYSVLNIHRIGIDAPVVFVAEQLSSWNARSCWWPNRLALLESDDRRLEQIRVYFLGRKKRLPGVKLPLFGLNVVPLFRMQALAIRTVPAVLNDDNARYMLYRCSGGYPVGIVVAYVRSPIAARGEPDQTQFFFAVGFDFYGKTNWPRAHPVNLIWEAIHDRVAGNILNRFKAECETRFLRVLSGEQRLRVETVQRARERSRQRAEEAVRTRV